MLDQTPQIPPAVIEFAKENNYKNISPNIFWIGTNSFNSFQNYQVFNVDDKDVPFAFILYKDKKARLATYEEILVLINIYL